MEQDLKEQKCKSEVAKILADYRLPPRIPFGTELAPVMFRADYRAGRWQDAGLVPFGPVAVNPASTALQFAQQAFEGMKAYRASGESRSCSGRI